MTRKTIALVASVLAVSSFGLRINEQELPVRTPNTCYANIAGTHPRYYRHSLWNAGDVQYVTNVSVGNQKVAGVLDTGSFELLVFPKTCTTCGLAAFYDRAGSGSYKLGRMTATHSFGSGSCDSQEAYETIGVGPLLTEHQSFWDVTKAAMPVLESSAFQAIVGLGPPGEPIDKAREEVQNAIAAANKWLTQGLAAPQVVLEQVNKTRAILKLEETKASLLENLGVTTFSTCLGKAPGSQGFFVWNDNTPKAMPSLFAAVPVVGDLTWGIKMKDVHLRNNKEGSKGLTIGCAEQCGVIVDTGTSLLGMPSEAYWDLITTLSHLDVGCDRIHDLPDLVFKLGDHEFVLPPDAYVGEMDGYVPEHMQRFIHSKDDMRDMVSRKTEEREASFAQMEKGQVFPNSNGTKMRYAPMMNPSFLKERGPLGQAGQAGSELAGGTSKGNINIPLLREDAKCQLLIMDVGTSMTQFGPMWLLGMPFFREYYTTFDLGTKNADGTKNKDRMMYAAKADHNCYPKDSCVEPSAPMGSIPGVIQMDRLFTSDTNRGRTKARKVDASKLRVPQWLHDRTKENIVRL